MTMGTTPYDANEVRVTEDSALRVLNANKGVRNIIPRDVMFDTIDETFDEIIESLSNHCGPLSRYALIIGPTGGKFETNKFTKDGRNIVDHMDYISSIENFIKEMISYLCSRVDAKAGDGTTTSALLAAMFFKRICAKFKNEKISTREFDNAYGSFHEKLNDMLLEEKYTIDQLHEDLRTKRNMDIEFQDLVAIIAAFQTLASSGGNVELANAMYRIYQFSPRGSWDYVNTYHSRFETDKLYSVDEDRFDYKIDAVIETPKLLNHSLETEFLDEKIDILAIGKDLHDEGLEVTQLMSYMSARAESGETKTLLILARSIGATLLRTINAMNASPQSTYDIVVFTSNNQLHVAATSLEIHGLTCVANVIAPLSFDQRFIVEENIIHDAKVHYYNFALHFHNLYESDINNPETHPCYLDPNKFVYYTRFKEMITQRIEFLTTHINHVNYADEIKMNKQILEKIAFSRRPSLRVGGSPHDHQAAVDVIGDVSKAINNSLTEGFISGSALSLLRSIDMVEQKYITKTITDSNKLQDKVLCSCTTSFKEATNKVIDIIFDNLLNTHTLKHSKGDYINVLNDDNANFTVNSLENAIETFNEDPAKYLNSVCNNYPILQPYGVYTQVLMRFKELLIKLVTTERMIVPGGVYVTKLDEK